MFETFLAHDILFETFFALLLLCTMISFALWLHVKDILCSMTSCLRRFRSITSCLRHFRSMTSCLRHFLLYDFMFET